MVINRLRANESNNTTVVGGVRSMTDPSAKIGRARSGAFAGLAFAVLTAAAGSAKADEPPPGFVAPAPPEGWVVAPNQMWLCQVPEGANYQRCAVGEPRGGGYARVSPVRYYTPQGEYTGDSPPAPTSAPAEAVPAQVESSSPQPTTDASSPPLQGPTSAVQNPATTADQSNTQQAPEQYQQDSRPNPLGESLHQFFNWVRFSLLVAFLVWLFTKRETLLYWYYSLRPHPARNMVEARVHGSGPIDGAVFAAIMRPVRGNRIEQRVRADQAHKLALMARRAADAQLADLERLKAEAVKEAAYLRSQEDLRSAVEAHELAMARLDALRAWRRRNAQRT
jgi:hypothetical protein